MAGRGKPSARVVLNRQAIDGVALAIADGTNAVAKTIITKSDPPDAAPFGIGLVRRGGWLTYVGSKKVAGGSIHGTQPKKPRSFRVSARNFIIKALAGWGFPSRFQEFGTVNMDPNPFFAAARDRIIPLIPGIMAKNAAYRIAKINRSGRG